MKNLHINSLVLSLVAAVVAGCLSRENGKVTREPSGDGESAAVSRAAVARDGWQPKFYNGLEAVGRVERVPKGYKGKVDTIRLVWESGAMKFGVRREVATELKGSVDWTVEAYVRSEGDYGYAGAAMEFFDAKGKSLGLVSSQKPVVAKEWRKVSWPFSAPKNVARCEIHLLSLSRDPVQFCKVKVSSRQGVDRGDIPFSVKALPAEWNRDWNGGTTKMLNFSDAPIPALFFMKGPKKGRKNLQLWVEIPAELEIKDACCPATKAYGKLHPRAIPFVTNGVDYVRYVFEKERVFEVMDPARYEVDGCLAAMLTIGPKPGAEKLEKSFRIFYRLMLKGKRGEDKSMEMTFRPLPANLRRAKDFKVFSWNNSDRHFSSDAAATAALRAYEAAGVASFRKTLSGGVAIPRQRELAALLAKRPVKHVFSGRFGDVWKLGACGLNGEKAKAIDVRMAVSSDPAYANFAKGKMCPEYFIRDPRLAAHLREFVHRVLRESNVTDGDWVTFDMEPWHSMTWCHCDECHKAFAAFAGLDRVPATAEILKPELADRWANFRCLHNEKSVELLTKIIREYNPTLQCVDYDYVMPYGDEKGMKARRRACGKDTLVNEKWLDGHLCSYYHKIDLESFKAIRNDTRHLKKFYVPMGAIAGAGGYLRPGEVLCPRQVRQFALAAFVNGCRGYAFYSGVCYDGEMLLAMMEAQDTVARYEGLPWGKVDGKTVPTSDSRQFAFVSTVRPDGGEVVALFNYDSAETIRVRVAGTDCDLAPYETRFVEMRK